jgi:hypothetical protein
MLSAASTSGVPISDKLAFVSEGDRFLVNAISKEFENRTLTVSDLMKKDGANIGFVYISRDVYPNFNRDNSSLIKSGFYTINAILEPHSSISVRLLDTKGAVVGSPHVVSSGNTPSGPLSGKFSGSIDWQMVCADYLGDTFSITVCFFW